MRRDLLKQTLISLQLEETYMTARHADVRQAERKEKLTKTFKRDFDAGLNPWDYFWPVALVTVFSFIGWFLELSRFHAISTLTVSASNFPDGLAFGFVGAFFASLLAVFEDFRRFNLEPASYYSVVYRLLFSSAAAYVLSVASIFDKTNLPMVAFGIGLFPVETTWKVITDKTAQIMGTTDREGEVGAGLKVIQGLEDRRNRQKMIDVDISTVAR